MNCPPWLNEGFLQTVLEGKSNRRSQLKIIKYSVSPGVDAGNNFASNLTKVEVDYYEDETCGFKESIAVLIKEPINNGFFLGLSNEFRFYEKEPRIYNELLPKMEEKLNVQFGPKSYHCPLRNVLILKDMRPEGFITANKYDQLDFSHCRIVLSTLAKFHATSVACFHEDSSLVQTLGKECFLGDGGPFENFLKPWIQNALQNLINALVEIGGQQWIIDWLERRGDKAADYVANLCKPKTSGLNVLNHGDCWVNNILFKHNEVGDIVDIRLIDYQMMRFSSPVLDVIYFIWTSAREDVRENQLQELFNIYLDVLNQTLELSGCEERMTLKEFLDDMKSNGDWFIFTLGISLPLIVSPPENNVELENFTAEDFKSNKTFQNLFKNVRYRALLPAISRQWQALMA